MIVKDEITADYIGIQCDVCETMAPDADAIREGHGLNNMGWLCSGGLASLPEPRAAATVAFDRPDQGGSYARGHSGNAGSLGEFRSRRRGSAFEFKANRMDAGIILSWLDRRSAALW